MLDENPRNYLIDVSKLFTMYCSRNAVDWVSDFLGGFNRLTDICCHIGLSLLKDKSFDIAADITKEVTKRQPIDQRYRDMTEKVVMSYSIVLRDSFLSVATVGIDRSKLNYVQIHTANLIQNLNPNLMSQRTDVATALTASFHWHI